MWRLIGLGAAALAITIFGFSLVDVNSSGDVSASAVLAGRSINLDGFARVTDPDYDWQFPQDHGPHPEYLSEWWYYTGNLAADDGRRFGYQFTIFRRAILPETEREPIADSEWRTNQIYLAHFTITDVQNETFYHDERLSRGAAGLAGAQAGPGYRVWLEDWEVRAVDDAATAFTMTAATDEASINLSLDSMKGPILQGEGGLSPKGNQPGNASYYYSMPRLMTGGTVMVDGETFTVEGRSWMDHEFGTSALSPGAQGWDWFGLIFDDNTEMMVGRIRMQDGGVESAFGGLFIYPDGSSVYLPSSSFTITPRETWTSGATGAEYPTAWDITVDADVLDRDEPLTISVDALMQNQELVTVPTYWEGAVRITGDTTGYGYAELTGYVDAMDGFF